MPRAWSGIENLIGWVNVREYGARGDGLTDDVAAIQAAFDVAATAAIGGTVVFPQGNYRINSTLTVTRNGLRIIGASTFQDGSVTGARLLSGTSGMTMIQAGSIASATFVNQVEIDSLVIDGGSGGTQAAIGLLLQNTHYSRFNMVKVRNFTGDGIRINDEIFDVVLSSIDVTGCNIGIRVAQSGANTIQKLHFFDVASYDNTTDQLLLNTTAGVRLFGGEYRGGQRALVITASSRFTAIGAQFEGGTTVSVDIVKASASSGTYALLQGSFISCNFEGNSASVNAIRCQGAQQVLIDNCISTGYTGADINFSNSGITVATNASNLITGVCRLESATKFSARDGLTVYYEDTWVTDDPQMFVSPIRMSDTYDNTAGTATSRYQKWLARGTVAVSGGTAAPFAVTAVRGLYRIMVAVTHAGAEFEWSEYFVAVSGNPASTVTVTLGHQNSNGAGNIVVTGAIAASILTITITNGNATSNQYLAYMEAVSFDGAWA